MIPLIELTPRDGCGLFDRVAALPTTTVYAVLVSNHVKTSKAQGLVLLLEWCLGLFWHHCLDMFISKEGKTLLELKGFVSSGSS